MSFNLGKLLAMRHSGVQNYAVPGLTSFLIGGPSPKGTVRMFECDRTHQEPITPHSHRFDFQCWVLRGTVRNCVWDLDTNGDFYHASRLVYSGEPGHYLRQDEENPRARWSFKETVYEEGEWYGMRADQIHSIFFSRSARVLFFEGPTIRPFSTILEPICYGEVVPTFRTEPWMFRPEPEDDA